LDNHQNIFTTGNLVSSLAANMLMASTMTSSSR